MRDSDPEKERKRGLKYYYKNKDEINKKRKLYRDSRPEKAKEYYKKNRESRRQRDKEYGKNHRKECNKRRRERMKTDIQFRLRICLGNRIRTILKGKVKPGKTLESVGCSLEDLQKYLESKFLPGMSWRNWGSHKGNWNVDHVFPLSKLDLTGRDQFLFANNYKNLQPLWFEDNMKKFNNVPEEIENER